MRCGDVPASERVPKRRCETCAWRVAPHFMGSLSENIGFCALQADIAEATALVLKLMGKPPRLHAEPRPAQS